MQPDPRLGPWGRLPAAWTASPRRRRLAFVALLLPGAVMAVSGAQILQSPPMLAVGVGWLAAATAVRWASEPRFLAREAEDDEPVEPQEETAS
ncbi:hypothetical protein [Caulobacter sp. FWC26]|uniref:hypothetical protein n=1 Tax=Caulobacter sp. FWC26 TaxID=69665 RepID=UPI000C46FEEB|nr:hypothetical protein [Caulobacter sp. FWC26]